MSIEQKYWRTRETIGNPVYDDCTPNNVDRNCILLGREACIRVYTHVCIYMGLIWYAQPPSNFFEYNTHVMLEKGHASRASRGSA